jgi:membrane-associated phospholipid phosphatase
VLIFLLSPAALHAQVDSLRKRPDVFRFADGVVYTFASPARWDGKDWLVLGGMLAGTTAITLVDQPVRDFWLHQDNTFLDGVERIGYHYGKPYSAVGLTAGFYLTGMIFKDEWAKETGLMLGTSIFSSSMMMGLLKNAAGRARPDTEFGHLEFQPFSQSPAYHAFPSGHSSVAFGISLLLARRVESVPLRILFYSLAGTTAVSRMYSDVHWTSDIAFGGMLAWFCADTAISRIQKNRYRRPGTQNIFVWKVYPYPGGVSLRASIH